MTHLESPQEGVVQPSCTSCGGAIDPARATYDKSGGLLCARCAAGAQIAEAEGRAASSLVGAAFGVFAAGVLSWTCVNVAFVVSIAAVVGGIGWLVGIGRMPHYKAKLGRRYLPSLVAAAVGLALGVLSLFSVVSLFSDRP